MALELLYRLLLVVSLFGGEVHSGYAPRYAKGVMEHVSRVRGLEPVGCMVSSARYEVGTWLWVWGENTQTLLHCRVTDASAAKDRVRHLKTKREVELGYNEAIMICGENHIQDPPTKCPVLVIKMP